ncbi:MAG: hypothetical protein WC269_01545 [Candidatus Gracilibacteria bacterium]
MTLLLVNPDEEFFIRELTRKLGEQINSVRRELDNLKKVGLLRAKLKNRKKYYAVNKEFVLFEDLRNIIIKSTSSNQTIANTIEKLGDVKLLAFSGLFVEKETTTVDMLIVGNLDKDKLMNYINNDLRTQRPVKFTVMTENDYKYRIDCKDKFLNDIINDSSTEIPIKRL